MKLSSLFLLCTLVLTAQTAKRAKNVILLLADAGGVPTLNAASIYGYNAPQKLFVQSWPNVALSDTSPVGRWVSDSAAGMTAIVTGVKTTNGNISTAPGDNAVLKTILEYAEEKGLATGVLSNVTITDATPGACYAHVPKRAQWGEIFQQLFTPRFGDGVDVLFGPGRKAIGDRLATLGSDFDTLGTKHSRPVYKTLAEVPADARRALVVAESDFDLDAAAKKAVSMLKTNKKGFFLMIESDAHTNNPEAGLKRLVAFDKLIKELTTLVDPKETLFLFTADHSFDLRTIGSGGPEKPILTGIETWDGKSKSIKLPGLRVDDSHTGEEVPVAAIGPGSQRVKGFMLNTGLFRVMMDAWGWK